MKCEVCVHTNDKQYHMESVSSDRLPSLVSHEDINENTKANSTALGGRIWEAKHIYWKQESSYQWINDKTIERMIKAAFLEPSMHTSLVIQKRNRSMSDAHIVVNWLGKKDEPYFTSDSILAFGWGPGRGIGGNITMNADVGWILDGRKITVKEAYELGMIENYDRNHPDNVWRTYDPLHTFKHEGGHALGMKHIETLDEKLTAIMYPYYNGLRKFGDADLKYIESLYGKANIRKEVLDYLRLRILNFIS